MPASQRARTSLVALVVSGVACGVGWSPLARTALAQPPATPRAVVQLRLDNDAFVRRDLWYTNGLEAALVAPLPTAGWTVRGAVGHRMYTPHNIRRDPPDPRDHAYAAHLYLDIGAARRSDLLAAEIGASLGFVGPAAGGEWMQDTLHRVRHLDRPAGWNAQISQRAAVGVLLRHALTPAVVGARARLVPLLSAEAELTSIRVGAELGVGVAVASASLPRLADASLARPSLTAPFRCDGACVAVFTTLDGGLVAFDDIAGASGVPDARVRARHTSWNVRVGLLLGAPWAVLRVTAVARSRRFDPTEPARHPRSQWYLSWELIFPAGVAPPATARSSPGDVDEG
jgi:hypothetical protein